MSSRTITVIFAAVFSLTFIADTASAQSAACDKAFDQQVSEARAALLRNPPGGMGQVDQLRAEPSLTMAESLNRQGKTTEAFVYLNYARGTLAIPPRPSASTAAGPVSTASMVDCGAER